MHNNTVQQQQLTVSSRIVGMCSSTKRRTAALVGVHGQISANVGLVGVVPLLYKSRRDSQASSSLPATSAACILPSSRLCPAKRTAASPACAVVASVSLNKLSWFE